MGEATTSTGERNPPAFVAMFEVLNDCGHTQHMMLRLDNQGQCEQLNGNIVCTEELGEVLGCCLNGLLCENCAKWRTLLRRAKELFPGLIGKEEASD